MIGSLYTLSPFVFTGTLWGKNQTTIFIDEQISSGTLNDLPNFGTSQWQIQDSSLATWVCLNPKPTGFVLSELSKGRGGINQWEGIARERKEDLTQPQPSHRGGRRHWGWREEGLGLRAAETWDALLGVVSLKMFPWLSSWNPIPV